MRKFLLVTFAALVLSVAGEAGRGWAADAVPGRLDAAQKAYQRGDLARAARELELALADLQERLGRGLADFLPPAPAGWEAEVAEVQSLGQVGGGLSVTRAYLNKDASLNVSLIVDSPAVSAAAALFANPAATAAQPNLKRIKLASEEAMLRWDPANRAGEVTMVLGGRVLLQIEGDNLAASDPLVELAKGWNVAGIRKFTGV